MKLFEKNPMVMIVLGVMGISVSSILVRYSSAPSAVTAALRLWWTVALMTPAVFCSRQARRELKSLKGKTLRLSALSGLFLAAHFALWFESLAHTTVASSTTIVCTEVIWVALGWRLLGGRLQRGAAAAIGAAFLGSVCIAWGDFARTGLYGDLLALLAAVAVAAYTLIGRTVRADTSNTVYTYIVYTACAVSLALLCLLQGHGAENITPDAVAVGALLALLSTVLGHSVFSWCLKYFSPAFVSASKLCEPVAAGVLAALLFREYPGPIQLLGAALVLGGVAWYARLESRRKDP